MRSAARFGQVVHFDGINDGVNFGTTAGNFGTADFTLAYWMRSTRTAAQAVMIKRPACSTGVLWDVRMTSTGISVEMRQDPVGVGGVSAPAALTDGQWHHVAVQRQGAVKRVYLDGSLLSAKLTSYSAPEMGSYRFGALGPARPS